MAGNPILALVSLILTAGAVVLQFFIVLSGAINSTPLNLVYWLEAPTQGIVGQGFRATARTAWTYWALCPIQNGRTMQCSPVTPAFPFDPPRNFALSSRDTDQIAQPFVGSNFYYLMSRFAWAFYLIALVFTVITLLGGVLALCSRIGGKISGATTFVALFFQALACALMTAWTVRARNAWNSSSLSPSGAPATLGRYAYGFSWGAFACLFIAMILFCVAGSLKKGDTEEGTSSGGGLFSRNRGSVRSRDGVKSTYS